MAAQASSERNEPSTETTHSDWPGPDDPDDPHNWSFGKKAYHSGITASYAFTTYVCSLSWRTRPSPSYSAPSIDLNMNRTFMSSIYASGTNQVADRFQVSSTVSILGLSTYCLGLSFGPILAAPLSETRGRSIVYRVSLPLTAVFTVGCAVANNMATIAVCRFFAGFFASPALAIGGGSLADMFYPSSRGVAMSLFLLAPFLGPAVGTTYPEGCLQYFWSHR
jgi:MFS family permease